MMKARNLGAILALGAVTVLPACSHNSSQTSFAAAPSTYNTANTASTGMMGTSGTVAPVSPDMIRKVQTTLKQAGDYKGHEDGIWGPMTGSGVRAWQQAHNLNTSGEIDVATLQSMNIPTGGPAGNSAATTQPTGNPNYSTGPSNAPGGSYSSDNGQTPANSPPATSSPAPANQGTTGTSNGATGSTTIR